jgi:hypothetical protein
VTVLEFIVAGCRKAGRPDAAQALEERTEEEWAQCTSGSGYYKEQYARGTVAENCSWTQCWRETPEGGPYWADVQDRLYNKEREARKAAVGNLTIVPAEPGEPEP